jgi:hypothetical protein
MGAVSNAATLTIVKRSVPPPIIQVMVPTGPLFSQDTIVIEGSASFSKCVLYRGDMAFVWTVATTPLFSAASIIPTINSTSAKLTIAAGTLSPGTTYHIRLVAALAGAGESAEVRTLVIEQSPLVAKIAGGKARLASLASKFLVDAAASFDPDLCKPAIKGEMQKPCADPSLQYAWSCTVPSTEGACRRVADDVALTFGNAATQSIDLPLLPDTLTSIVVTVTVFKNTRSASSSITIELTKAPVLQVSINLLKTSPERLLLQSVVVSSSSYACKWNISGQNIPVDANYQVAPYNDLEFVRTGWEASTLSLLLESAAGSLILLPGTTYTVALACKSADSIHGQASHSWRIPVPPWGGTCGVSSNAVIALTETLTVSCSTWSAEELPIRYSFGIGLIVPGAVKSTDIRYTVLGFASVGAFKLPEGNYTSMSRVCDSANTCTSSASANFTVKAAVLKPRQSEEDAVTSSINDMASLAQSGSLLTASDSIIAIISEGASNRRLLASTSAYRIRVKRLLMNRLAQGSVGAEMSTESASRVLSSVRKLSSNPQDVDPQASSNMVSLLESGSANILADQLRGGGFATVLSVCENAISTANIVLSQSSRDDVFAAVKNSLQNALDIFVRSMTSDEVPFVSRYQYVGIIMARQPPKAVTYSYTLFYGTNITYNHGIVTQSATSRRQQAPGDGVGVYVVYFSQPWQIGNSTSSKSQAIGVYLVKGGILPLPLPSPKALHQSTKCSSPGCLVMWLRVPVPPSIVLTTENNTQGTMAYFLSGIRCRHWQGYMWSETGCVSSQITYASESKMVLVQCTCDMDGFLYVDWIIPPSPELRYLKYVLKKGHKCLTFSLIYLVVTGAALALVVAVIFSLSASQFAMPGQAVRSHGKMTYPERSILLWTKDVRARAVELKWVNSLRPSVRDTIKGLTDLLLEEPLVKADFGVVSINLNGNAFWKVEKDVLGDDILKSPTSVGARKVSDRVGQQSYRRSASFFALSRNENVAKFLTAVQANKSKDEIKEMRPALRRAKR